jgi:hypothetical protein
MPRGEYDPVPQVQPQQIRRQADRIEVPIPHVEVSGAIGQAFRDLGTTGYGTLSRATEAAAQAYDRLGKTFDNVGNEIFNRAIGLQDLENETKVNQAAVEYGAYEGQQKMEIDGLKGEGATSQVLAAKQQEWEAKRQELRNKLPLTSRGAFDGATTHILGGMVNYAADHFATQTRLAASGAATALNSQDIERAIRSDSPEDIARFSGQIHDRLYNTVGPSNGWARERTDKEWSDIQAQIAAGKIKDMGIAKGDPTTALDMLEANRKQNDGVIDTDTYEKLHNTLMDEQTRQVGRNIGEKTYREHPDATVEEVRDIASKEAAEKYPNNPDAPHAAGQQAMQFHRQHQQDVKEQNAKDWQLVQNALAGRGNPDGKVPTKEEELFANGDNVKGAYGRLTAPQLAAAKKIMGHSALGDYPETEESMDRFETLKGMAIRDPAAFRDLVLADEKLPWKRRDALINVQNEIIRKGISLEQDPHTEHVLNYLRAMHATPKDILTGSQDKQHRYTGIIQDLVQAREAQIKHARPLNEQEMDTIGKIAIDRVQGTGWFKSDVGATRLFEDKKLDEVPPNYRDRMQRLDPDATEEQIARQYRRHMLALEYERYTKEGASIARKPGSPTPETWK